MAGAEARPRAVSSPAKRRGRGSSRSNRRTPCAVDLGPPLPAVETGLPFDRKGQTFLDAVALGVGDALRADPRVFVYGEDVGGRYGNAFLLLRPLLTEFGDRIINSPLAEGGVLGVCVGAALAGQRPIGEMQFNDFVASGFNQLVNNAAKIRYRWGGSVPMVVRMPWGGLRHAGPYHSQNTEPWFYRTPGLKIVAPSTPAGRAGADGQPPSPIRIRCSIYEHIALYRDPRIKQALPSAAPSRMPLGQGRAAPRRRRPGDHLVRRVRARRDARGASACGRRHRRRACSTCARSSPLDKETRAARGPPLQPRADRPRGLANRRHRREPRRDHSGGGVRIARRAGAHPRRTRHAGAVLAAARGVFLPSEAEIERAARLLVSY